MNEVIDSLELDMVYIDELQSEEEESKKNSQTLPNLEKKRGFLNENKKYSLPDNIVKNDKNSPQTEKKLSLPMIKEVENKSGNSSSGSGSKGNSPLSPRTDEKTDEKVMKKNNSKGSIIAKNKIWKSNVISFSREDITSISDNNNLLRILEQMVEKDKKKKIDSINLNDNKLESLDEKDLDLMVGICFQRKLKSLILSNNLIKSLNVTNLKNLKKLDLSNNRLKCLPTGIEKLSKLQILLLARNHLTDITTLSSLIYLEKLDVSENLISQFPKKLMECLCLKKVNVQMNPIINPPNEICMKGWKSMIQYWKGEEGFKQLSKSKKLENMIRQESYSDEDLNKEALLTVILSSHEGTEQLRLYLQSVYAEENLKFLEKVREYEKSLFIQKGSSPRRALKKDPSLSLFDSAPTPSIKFSKKVKKNIPEEEGEGEEDTSSSSSNNDTDEENNKVNGINHHNTEGKEDNQNNVGNLQSNNTVSITCGKDSNTTTCGQSSNTTAKTNSPTIEIPRVKISVNQHKPEGNTIDDTNDVQSKKKVDSRNVLSVSTELPVNKRVQANKSRFQRNSAQIPKAQLEEPESLSSLRMTNVDVSQSTSQPSSPEMSKFRKMSTIGETKENEKHTKQHLSLKSFEIADFIFNEFVSTTSEQNVNLPFDLIKEIDNDLKDKNYHPALFTKAQKHIFSVLAVDKIIPFKKSSFYEVYKNSQKKNIFNALHGRKRFSHQTNKEPSYEKLKHSPRYSHQPQSNNDTDN